MALESSYLNEVLRVSSADSSQSCIAKVFLPFAKFVGPSVPLEVERCQRQHQASVYIQSLIPDCCEVPLFCDDVNNILCLRDFTAHKLWQEDLMTSCDLHLGGKLVDALVILHSHSHVTRLGQAEFAKLKAQFSPLPQLMEFQHSYTFVKPFQTNHRDNKPCDEKVRLKIDELAQDAGVSKAMQLAQGWLLQENASCLIHGDLHSGAVLASSSRRDIKIIDTECARAGPEAFDIARLVCSYVLLYHYHHQKTGQGAGSSRCDHTQLMADTVDLICITLSRYMEGMSKELKENFDRHLVWKQILLFMGLEIIAWISGPMSLACLESFPEAQIFCLNTALRLLHRQTLSLDARGVGQLIHDSH